jgi:hypothetical protein
MMTLEAEGRASVQHDSGATRQSHASSRAEGDTEPAGCKRLRMIPLGGRGADDMERALEGYRMS